MIEGLTVSANFAIAADGKISSFDNRPSGWTSTVDHHRLMELRQNVDAVIVGRRTLQNDNMSLTTRGPRQPLRCVVTRYGELRDDEKVFTTPGGEIHILCTERSTKLHSGARTHTGDLLTFLQTLHEQLGVKRLHCEGGGQLMSSLLALDCVATIHITWAAHTLMGGAVAATISGATLFPLQTSVPFSLSHCEPVLECGEIFLTYQRSVMPKRDDSVPGISP